MCYTQEWFRVSRLKLTHPNTKIFMNFGINTKFKSQSRYSFANHREILSLDFQADWSHFGNQKFMPRFNKTQNTQILKHFHPFFWVNNQDCSITWSTRVSMLTLMPKCRTEKLPNSFFFYFSNFWIGYFNNLTMLLIQFHG